MSELYGDQYDSVATGPSSFFPDGLRRLVAAAFCLGLILAMGTWAYRLGTRDAREVPIIRAMEGPARIQPDDPGGLTAAHQGLEVNSVLAGRPGPVPETAAPLALPPVLLTDEDGPQGELVIATPENFGQTDLLADDELPMPLQDDGPDPVAPDPVSPDALALETPPTADPGATTALALKAEPTLEDAIAAAIAAEAAPATPAPAADATSTDGPRRRPANLVLARAAPAAAASPAAAREVANPGAGARLVQLGAYDSEALTRQAWGRLLARHGDLLGAKSLYVERTTANARVFYRLRVAGFDSSGQTGALCEALRARAVDCIPVTLQ